MLIRAQIVVCLVTLIGFGELAALASSGWSGSRGWRSGSTSGATRRSSSTAPDPRRQRAYTRRVRSVASIGRWSARRPWRAIAAWLAFVALAIACGIATGTESLENGAVGESARGYALIDAHRAWPPAREYGYLHSDTLRARDARLPGGDGGRCGADALGARRRRRDPSLARPASGARRRRRQRPLPIEELRAAVLAAGAGATRR